MYSTKTLQVKLLVENVPSVIKQEKDIDIEFAIQSEVAFLTNKDRKELYSSYDRYDEEQKITHNHRKVTTVYCAPKFRKILAIHLLSAFSSDPEPKYITTETQQRFVPSPVECIAYQPHRSFSAYLIDSGRISVITERAESIESLIPEHFHLPFSMDKDPSLHISLFNIVAKMPRTFTENLPSSL